MVINYLQDPTLNNLVKSLLKAGTRFNSVSVKKQEDTINSEMLKDLCYMFKSTDDVLHLRDLMMILLSYAGFLTYGLME